ncbi:MAG: Holliday junction resolvase RuvX [Chloroflexota bacterium]|nr:Holliday junction resolvase RuvX [Chloroflexota bacterium]
MTRLLGIDLGLRRIGLAVAETASGEVVPLATIRRSTPERDGRTIARIAAEQAIDELIVGLPLLLDGSIGRQAAETEAWALSALAGLDRPVSFRDERLTTERAELCVGRPARGRSGAPPSAHARQAHRARIDREAAALILQAELDARSGVGGAA